MFNKIAIGTIRSKKVNLKVKVFSAFSQLMISDRDDMISHPSEGQWANAPLFFGFPLVLIFLHTLPRKVERI